MILAGENSINDVKIEKEIEDTFVDFTSAWFDGESKSVLLKVTGNARHYLERKPPINVRILSQSDEALEIQFNDYNEIEVLNFVKKWLPEVKILDAPEIDQKLKDSLLEYLDND